MTTTPSPDAGQPEIASCPFCEATGENVFAEGTVVHQHVHCAVCQADGPLSSVSEDEIAWSIPPEKTALATRGAIERWNRRAPLAPPREVTEAMVELAAREMHTINVEEANADRKAHGLALPEKWADPFESPSMARQLAKLKREATRIVTAALNAPARTASDLNIERQVAGLGDIDRDDAAKWRAVSEECEKAGCCLLNAPPQAGGNITHAHCYICGRSGQISCERPDCPTKELVANGAARADENALP